MIVTKIKNEIFLLHFKIKNISYTSMLSYKKYNFQMSIWRKSDEYRNPERDSC